MSRPILTAPIAFEDDVVAVRQRAKRIAAGLGFDAQDQTRIATAVSEIARNAFRYAGGGRVQFLVSAPDERAALIVIVSDAGPGIVNLEAILDGQYRSTTGMGMGIQGARRLVDGFNIDSSASGTRVLLTKYLPRNAAALTNATLARLMEQLAADEPQTPLAALQAQNRELLDAMSELKTRQDELRQLNRELEDTNRGVVALYAELDQRAEALRRANEAKSRFLANLSHELRTPLNSIRALSGLLLERVDGALSAEQEKQVGLIRRSAENLSEMVDDLLDLAKAESGKLEIHATEFSVAELFGSLRAVFKPLQRGSPVALVFEAADSLPRLYSDEQKLTQILRNLISNALKFTEHGEVRVRADYDAERRQMIFAVSDTGIGIAAEHHERIFEEFAQVENPLQARVRGTGLGLPLSRRLAELLGGTITVDSRPGHGSVFRLQITAAIRPAPDAPAPASIAQPLWRVLIIDDDALDRYVLRQALQRPGVEVIEAPGGEAGLRLAHEQRPQLIVLDLKMPNVDGYAVLDALQSDPVLAAIPVLVATSSALDAATHARLSRAHAVMAKGDVTRDALQKLIDRLQGPV